MRVDSSGDLLVGTTSVNYAGSGFTLSKDSGTTKWLVGPAAGAPTNFYVSGAASLGVYLSGTSATSWSSASDERLKDIIEPIADGLQKVNTLRAVIGSYKADETKTRRSFLIAQDLQNVLPEAVDASNPDALGVQYTEVIPLLVAAIQELSAKNDALEARLAALETK
jgi:Chaperone of endosialidase